MDTIQIERNVFESISDQRRETLSSVEKVLRYIEWSRESQESRTLGNLIAVLFGFIVFLVVFGLLREEIDLTITGIHDIMHLSAFIFSLFALLIAKKSPDMHLTYGYTRYETLAAFSNCLFLNLSALFLLMSTLHYFTQHDEGTYSDSPVDVNNGAQIQTSHHGDGDSSMTFTVILAKLVFNLVGIFSFIEYAFFAPTSELGNIGPAADPEIQPRDYAYSGVNESSMKNFVFKYQKFYRFLALNGSDLQDDSKPKQLSPHPCSSSLHFTSHFENMHSVFLHFFVDFLFGFVTLMTSFFAEGDYVIFSAILPLLALSFTVFLTKKLFVTTFKLLLQALPIDDERGIRMVLSEITSLKEVVKISQQHFWGLTTGSLVCNITVCIRKNSDASAVQTQIHEILAKKFYSFCVQLEESKDQY